MQSFYNIEYLKNRLRLAFRDDYNIQWSDALLDEIIFESQREYCLYSGRLLGTVDIVSKERPILDCPDDFIKVVQAFDNTGKVLPIISFRRLAAIYGDFRTQTGNTAKFLVFDFDDHKKYRIFPHIPAGIKVGEMHYQRLPQDEKIEVSNFTAVEAHCLYMMFLMVGKDIAAVWYNKFLELVNKDNSMFCRPGISRSVKSGRCY